MTIAHIPAGYLADRIGRKPLLQAAWIIGTIATWFMALAPSLPGFVFGLMIYNLTAFVMAPMSSYITAARGKLSIGRALTMVSAMYNTGAILGPWLGGQVGQHFGLRTIYTIAGSAFVLSTIVLFFIKAQPIDIQDVDGNTNGRFLDGKFITYQMIIFLAGFSMYLAQPLSSNYLQNQHQLSLDSIGILGSISSIGIVILNLGLGNLKARTGFLLAELSVGVFTLLLWKGTGFPLFSLAYFLIGGYRLARSLATAQTRSLVPQSRMGLAYGITETISAAAVIFASLAAGFLYERDPSLMFIVGFCLILVSFLVSMLFIPRSNLTT
ncbi:MAG: hypothetical protein A2136_06290 [Chloroflexi bacterium RBG_16_54_11]|nr:MAG: hypothetical protein A2136_06290 [Chloroflexi bacterium RBG_16_54_11]